MDFFPKIHLDWGLENDEDDAPDICSHCMCRVFLLYIAHNANFFGPDFFPVPDQIYYYTQIVTPQNAYVKCLNILF